MAAPAAIAMGEPDLPAANQAATPDQNQEHCAVAACICIRLLEKVRVTRNEVMHFDPDGIEDEKLAVLREFAKLLRALQTIGVT